MTKLLATLVATLFAGAVFAQAAPAKTAASGANGDKPAASSTKKSTKKAKAKKPAASAEKKAS